MKMIGFVILFFLCSFTLLAQWSTNGSSIYYNGGNVGIGTATPAVKLHILGSIRGSSDIWGALRIDTGNGYLDIGAMNSNWAHLQTDRPRFYFEKEITVDSGIISTYDEDMQFKVPYNTTAKVIIKTSGNVGIGTTTPDEKLTIQGNIHLYGPYKLYFQGGVADPNYFIGHFDVPASAGIEVRGFGGVRLTTMYGMVHVAQYGNVGIGTTSPDQLLTVNGNIHAKEIIVNTSIPDYVFKPDYKLLTLSQIESFIQQNGHLPGVPSQAEISESGVSLGEFNRILLEKIEELTLYNIEQAKINAEQSLMIEQLRNEIQTLKNDRIE